MPPWISDRLWPITQAENIGRKIGNLVLFQGDLWHRVLGQHNMRYDRSRRLSRLVRDLVEARNIDIGVLLLAGADQMAVGAEPLGQFLAVLGIGSDRHGAGRA